MWQMVKRPVTKSDAERVLNRAHELKKRDQKRTKFVHGPGRGDVLASGAPSCTYRMPDVSQLTWDLVFLTDKEFWKAYHRTKEQARG